LQIADYFASFSLKIDKASVKKADATLDRIESRLNGMGGGGGFRLGKFSINQGKLDATLAKALDAASLKAVLNITKFDVNQTALNIALGNALDLASARNTFHIARFNVDQSHLNAQMVSAMANAARIASASTTLRPHVASQHMQPTAERGVSRRGAALTGGIAGGLSRLYAPALGLALGGYGLSQLNQRNQQVVSAQLQSQAVVQQAGGTTEQGQQSFQWLRSEGNRIGFNYLDASGDYNKLLSGLTGAGMSVAQGQGVFKGFSELSRVNKLDRTQQQRVYRALSQVAGKNKLQSEELTGQLAESLPGAVSIFAQAYQNQLAATGKGGGKQGQDAITELLAAMKKGQVKGDILTYAGSVASQRAAPGLAAASTASQAEQARYQNSVNDLAVVASNSGVEEGFARIFRTLNAGLSESNDLVKTLAEGFNDATKWADDLLLWPQSFIRALEGKDSLVADWLGVGQTAQLQEDWKQIKQIFTDISSLKFDFLPTLQATSREIASILGAIAEFEKWKNGGKDTTAPKDLQYKSDTEKASLFGFEYTSPAAIVSDIYNNAGVGLNKARIRGRAVYEDPTSPFYQNPEKFDADRETNALYYQNLTAIKADPEGANIGSAVQDAIDNDTLQSKLNSVLSSRDILSDNYKSQGYGLDNQNPMMSAMGLFNNYEATTPSGEPFQDLSQYGPKSPEEIADWNKSAAMAAADQAVTNNNNQSNQFDIQISIDGATLMGMDVAGQGQALADAFTAQVTAAFEHAQTNFPIRE